MTHGTAHADSGAGQHGWDEAFDAVVVGSGAAGMSAALTASIEGLSVLLVEKTDRVGGSTAVSGGAVWLPLNHRAAASGNPDSIERVRAYLDATVGEAAPPTMREAFLAAGPAALEYLERHTELRLAARTAAPEYYPDRPGAASGGRTLDPVEFDGRRLGRHFAELRDPLAEFLVLGGMMVTVTDVRHLLAATRSFASWRESMRLVTRYASDRLRGYHRGTRLVLGNALAARLYRSVLDRGIPVRLRTAVVGLVAENGAVSGVELEGPAPGQRRRVRALRGVILATGGFPWDAARRGEAFPQPNGPWSMAPRGNAGDGIRLATQAGAALGTGHAHPAFWAPVSVWERPGADPVRYPHLVWDRAKPGLIAVDPSGRRFVDEATSYHEFVIAMLRRAGTAFLLCDSDFIEKWGLGLALPGGRPRQHLIDGGYLHRADSLAALATALGIEPATLEQTVREYNEHAERGEDPVFHKGENAYDRYLGDPDHRPNPCVAPLRRGPFYAVKVYPGDIGTAHGLATDAHCRVLDREGRPMPGLLAAGNDMQSVMGGQYPAAGITLGPALAFGYVAGMMLGKGVGEESGEG